jgi:hypothetical protein
MQWHNIPLAPMLANREKFSNLNFKTIMKRTLKLLAAALILFTATSSFATSAAPSTHATTFSLVANAKGEAGMKQDKKAKREEKKAARAEKKAAKKSAAEAKPKAKENK